MDYSATAMLASIRRRASIPTTTVNGSTDADLLRLANEELQLGIVADIMAVREEYFVRDFNHTISSGVTAYRIPDRAIGGKLRRVSLVASDGSTLTLPRIEPENADGYAASSSTSGYSLQGNNVVLIPSASTTYTTLRLSYYVRPNEIVSSGTQAVTGLSGTTFTVAATTGFTTSTLMDIISGTPPFEHLAIDLLPTAVTGTTVVFSSIPYSVAYFENATSILCLAEQAPVAQVPAEWIHILCQRVAVKYLEAAGQQQELAAAQKILAEMEKKALILLSPRDDSGHRKIVGGAAFGAIPSGPGWNSGG